MKRSSGSVLVVLLWCVALLAIVVITLLHGTRMELRVAKNYADSVQAYYLALAGVEKAKALIFNDAAERKRSARSHTGELFDAPQHFRDVRLGRGQFSIIRQASSEDGGQLLYGVCDEEARLNVNQTSAEELGKIIGITSDIAAAIIDWRDSDNAVTPGGAEADYYTSLRPPYLPRNAPFQTLRELLFVRGISPELLLGEDTNANRLLDAEENDGTESLPADNQDGYLDAGWSEFLTTESLVRNVSASGQTRVNVQTADEAALTGVRGISSEIARAIIAYRGQNRLESIFDLLDVTAARPQPQNQPAGNGANLSGGITLPQGQPVPSGGPQSGNGPRVLSEELLMEIADDVTAASEVAQVGAINLNTASPAVLICLPGVTRELARAIVSYRQSAGFLPNVAWLLKVPGFNSQLAKQTASRVTTRSETFRILSEGRVTSSGVRKRIEAIVRLGAYDVSTLSYREDL